MAIIKKLRYYIFADAAISSELENVPSLWLGFHGSKETSKKHIRNLHIIKHVIFIVQETDIKILKII